MSTIDADFESDEERLRQRGVQEEALAWLRAHEVTHIFARWPTSDVRDLAVLLTDELVRREMEKKP